MGTLRFDSFLKSLFLMTFVLAGSSVESETLRKPTGAYPSWICSAFCGHTANFDNTTKFTVTVKPLTMLGYSQEEAFQNLQEKCSKLKLKSPRTEAAKTGNRLLSEATWIGSNPFNHDERSEKSSRAGFPPSAVAGDEATSENSCSEI